MSRPPQLLSAIAARADAEGYVKLTAAEVEFALTLDGRRLLHRFSVDSNQFRLSSAALALLVAEGLSLADASAG
ncbi:MAG: hypothetical protein KGL18_02290 [Burkholderiales bacterium]|nr:hypothetical protein [Burkholderiales bacterium]MDE1926637.1 hypothetical protein [Burkholderiales bacterium]MDE2159030.1 hypothetical protein [Burkholderiales bacterium]MDE2501797.1 hypothetical protein [Burkholderiales bacterium]